MKLRETENYAVETKPVSAKYGFFVFASEAKHNVIHGAMLMRKSHTAKCGRLAKIGNYQNIKSMLAGGKIRQDTVWSSLTIFLRCLDRPEKETVLSAC
jgi:hypothetical protein